VAKHKTTTDTTPGTASSQDGSKGENISGYFRKLFEQNRAWLESRSNDDVLAQWLKDHPDQKTVPERVKQNLSNVKSVMRQKLRSKAGRKKGSRPAQAASVTAAPITETPRKTIRGLDTLEEQIDDCLTFARSLDRVGLANIIVLLRRARNEVVWKLGER